MKKVSNPFLKFHIAEVVDIDDPDKNGRSKLRIAGQHDDKTNIPDKDLPWAVPMLGSDNPAINKIGSSGNGLLKGSKVLVTFWDLGQGQQQPIILGSVGASGKTQNGSTQNSSTEIDKKKGDSPTASRSKDVNTVVDNPIQDSKKTPGTDNDDANEKNIYDDTRKKAKFKETPSIGSANTVPDDSLVKFIKKIDPSNLGGSVKNALDSLLKLEEFNKMSTPTGIQNLASKILAIAMINNSKTLSEPKVYNQINKVMPLEYDEKTIELLQKMIIDLNTHSSKSIDEILEDETEEIKTIIKEILEYIHDELHVCLQNERLTKQYLEELILKIVTQVNEKTNNKTLGCQDSDMASKAESLVPVIGSLITKSLNDFLPKSVLDQDKMKKSLNQFTKNQGLLEKKKNIMDEIFKGGESSLSSLSQILSSMKSNFNFIDPKTKKAIGNG